MDIVQRAERSVGNIQTSRSEPICTLTALGVVSKLKRAERRKNEQGQLALLTCQVPLYPRLASPASRGDHSNIVGPHDLQSVERFTCECAFFRLTGKIGVLKTEVE